MHEQLDDMEGLEFKNLTIRQLQNVKKTKRELTEKEKEAIRNEQIKADIDRRWSKKSFY